MGHDDVLDSAVQPISAHNEKIGGVNVESRSDEEHR